eukprot:104159-Pyramimonas_sp.AAC.2
MDEGADEYEGGEEEEKVDDPIEESEDEEPSEDMWKGAHEDHKSQVTEGFLPWPMGPGAVGAGDCRARRGPVVDPSWTHR